MITKHEELLIAWWVPIRESVLSRGFMMLKKPGVDAGSNVVSTLTGGFASAGTGARRRLGLPALTAHHVRMR